MAQQPLISAPNRGDELEPEAASGLVKSGKATPEALRAISERFSIRFV